jgi:hypothetical protein
MGTEVELFESTDLTPLDFFCGVGWKVDTRDELLAGILGSAACMNERDQLRWTKRDLRTRVAKCV